MTVFTCGRKNNCTVFAIIASAIIGVVAAFLTFTATITVTPAFLWVVFGIAVGYLAVLLTVTGLTVNPECRNVKAAINTMLAGILGTILFAIILLAITFAATSVVGAIIVGLLLFFFSLTVTATACLVKAYTDCE